MRQLVSTGLILLLLFMARPIQATSGIELSETVFDYGRMSQGITVDHTFWIKSTGTDTLVITHIFPGCGCTKAPIEDSVLAPGDSTRLQIFFSSRRYEGKLSKEPYLLTNVSQDRTSLEIKAEPMVDLSKSRPVYIEPAKVDVSQFTTKPRLRATFKIVNKGAVEYRLNLVEKGGEFFDIEMPRTLPPGEEVTVTVIVKDSVITNDFEKSITVELIGNTGDSMRFSIPVKRMYRIKEDPKAE